MEPGTDGPPRQRMQVQFRCGAREFRVLAFGFVQPDGTFLSLKRTMPDKDGPAAPDDVPFQPLDGGSMTAMYEATCAAH